MKPVLHLFDRINTGWVGRFTPRIISTILIIAFLSAGVLTLVKEIFGIQLPFFRSVNLFLAIDVSFSLLLIFEILGLIFTLPKSVADSVGKQFEVLSIVLLRSAFKEFGHFFENSLLEEINYTELYPMLSDAFGALIIFLIIGFYYRKQRHERIMESDREQQKFINFKKYIAFILLISYIVIGVWDVSRIIFYGYYQASLNTFYTLLIFSDILILLYSLRFQSRYINLFRYSSFAFATVLIRLSLSAPAYFNVLIGILAGSFVLGLTLAYNYYRELPLTE